MAQDGAEGIEIPGGISFDGQINTLVSSLDQDFSGGGSADTSSIDVNSVELGLTVSPLKPVDAKVVWLLEEDPLAGGGSPDDGFAVDQAYVTIAGNHRMLSDRDEREGYDVNPMYLQAGKMYSPFGTQMEYHTFDVVSEPQTLALSETLETMMLAGYTPGGGLNVYGGIFRGDGPDSSGDSELDDFVGGLDYEHGLGMISVQWTNNINNSIALVEELGSDPDENSGLSVYGQVQHDHWTLQAAHVRAMDEYEDGLLVDSQPQATTFELTYGGLNDLFGLPVDGTAVYEQTDEWLDHPESVAGAVLDASIYSGVTGSVEYLSREYDPDFSTGLDEERLVAFQLSVGFGELLTAGGSQ